MAGIYEASVFRGVGVIEVYCPQCRSFICAVSGPGLVRAYCRRCKLRFEVVACAPAVNA